MTIIQKIILGTILLAFFLLETLSVRRASLTYDEPKNFRYGVRILSGEADRETAGAMPINSLNALPSAIGRLLPAGGLGKLLSGPFAARLATIIFALLIGGCVFAWTAQMYGTTAAFFSLTLFVLCPEVIAHSRLIHSDFFSAGMITLSLYCFWRFLAKPCPGRGIVGALALGLAQVTKYTSVLLYPICLAVVLVRYSVEIARALRERRVRWAVRGLGRFAAWTLVFIGTGILIINLAFLFRGFGTPLGSYRFRSGFCRGGLERIPGLRGLPLPLPYPYLQGIDWLQWKAETGDGFGYMYLFGELKKTGGFRNYFLYAFLFKMPIAIQAFILLAVVNYLARRGEYEFRRNEAFLLVPAAVYAIYYLFFVHVHIGIRYLLPLFPLLFVFCGSFFREWPRFGKGMKSVVIALLLYLGVSTLSYYPHFLSYFNEFVWDRKQAWRLLADSNLDWGQSKWYLAEWRKTHPDVIVNPPFPQPGRIVVSVNDLVGVWDPEKYRWLRENFEPVDHIAYSYLVFEIPPSAGAPGKQVP